MNAATIIPLTVHRDARGWLCELFRLDESPVLPVMGYLSVTLPGVTRGPHEHRDQTDRFVFASGTFELTLDGTTTLVGETNPVVVVVPPGVIHSYRNVGTGPGIVVNLPDRLYRGWKRMQPTDEIRHEDEVTP